MLFWQNDTILHAIYSFTFLSPCTDLARSNWFVSLDAPANLAFLVRWMELFTSFWSAAYMPDVPSGGKPFRADLIVASSHAFGERHASCFVRCSQHHLVSDHQALMDAQ